jgi:hypothetical protein
MKTAIEQQDAVAFHVRIFSRAELRSLMLMAILIAILLDLFR